MARVAAYQGQPWNHPVENMLINRGFHDINPLLCGEARYAPSWASDPSMREYYLLHYVFSGSGSLSMGGREYPARAGQLFIVEPYVVSSYQAGRDTPWHVGWVGFESALDLSFLFSRPVIDIPRAEGVFRSIHASASATVAKELFICSKLYELLSLLSEQSILPQEQAPPYILKALNYIESNYMQPISVAKLAAGLNLDRSYFSTSFKQVTGKSPQQYLVDYRLEKAASLMLSHGCRPGQAARCVGYPDIFNFSRMFKRRFGISPSEYILKGGEYPLAIDANRE